MFSYEFSQDGAGNLLLLRARLPPNFITSQKSPRMQQNLHLVTTSRSPANAILTRHAATMTSFAAFPIGMATFCHHGRASVARPHVPKCHACHAKRSYVTLATSKKNTPFATFPIGTATLCHHGRASTCHKVPRLPCEMKLHHT